MKHSETALNRASYSQMRPLLGLAVGLVFFLISTAIAYSNIQSLRESDHAIRHTHNVLIAMKELLSSAQDAETGQRGFLLTGTTAYLDPYKNAVADLPARLETLDNLTSDNPVQQANLAPLKRHVDDKLGELRESIELRETEGITQALTVISSDRGKIAMDGIREQLDIMAREELRLRQVRLNDMADASRWAVLSSAISGLLGAALTIALFFLLRRNQLIQARQDWLQFGEVGLATVIRGDKPITQLAEDILAFLAHYIGVQGGAIFKGENGHFRQVATYGVPTDAPIPVSFGVNEGLLGQVAAEGRTILLNDVPDGYLTIGSALGRDKPRNLVIFAGETDGVVNSVIELGFFDPIDDIVLQFLGEASGAIGIALRSARFRAELQDALEETQRQAGELQAQSEELRVSNEELEEHGRALKESHARLEQQQVELEQTNSQLEEQAQILETQREDLERAGNSMQLKARELERASQYKSDFLANMSHELRTPLNSLLILSKLLADNPQGNLSDEQIKYARTIESSGNDLLLLINDILDLSKIEAGHVEIRPESLSLQRLTGDLRQLFTPIADERELQFNIDIGEDCVRAIVTDKLRLEQILKNLLSNAFKFTEHGSVDLKIYAGENDMLAFEVKDTGIGISPEQRDQIFEAFHQADGTISRKYGGTGLGLSISRELARLLGGAITFWSEPGEGSIFTLKVPATPAQPVQENDTEASRHSDQVASPAQSRKPAPTPSQWAIEDDRGSLQEGHRLLLVIEDDPAFASIVCDLSREMGFQCVIASTAEEALSLAKEFRPSAVVLDLGLPDQSGLTVLDRLKHDDDMRHIPIHVISASDYTQTALSLGAVGYHVKPVKQEQLAEVLSNLHTRLSTSVRRVLIVEDDPVQREAVSALLLSDDVETVGVGTAAECLEQLSQHTFDCMVLDLSLPDTSGFLLLETLSREEGHGFPPVIVYTGHELSPDDEQQLRRYSNSIIIKGAKSPERLLDEVSLFLHQVVSELPVAQRKMIEKARHRDATLEGRRILIVEDDVRNVYSLSSVLESRGAIVQIARNGQEAIDALEGSASSPAETIDLVLMDVMMPVKDGLTATREIRLDARWTKLPIVMLTAKAMPDDQQRCLEAGANDYMAKPIDIDKLLSLVRVWMPR